MTFNTKIARKLAWRDALKMRITYYWRNTKK